MTSSVDPRLELDAIKARLDALAAECYLGIEQEAVLPIDGFGNVAACRNIEPGSVVSKGGRSGRLLAAGEQAQPYIWALQIQHVASSRQEAFDLSVETDMSLIGWAPSSNAGPLSPFFFTLYDETAKAGDRVRWIATRFYETELGQNPTL